MTAIVADIAIKLFNSFNSKNGRITSVGSLTKLVVEVPSSTAYENKVGGYLFIRVPAISAFEWHPFSLAHTEGNQLTFYIQSQRKGSWTHKLNSKASNGLGEGVPLSVSLEGPYGNLSLDLANYRSLNMIAGGIGITPFINILTCIRRDPRYSSVQQINVFWSMRGLDLLETFQKEIQSFMEAGSSQDTDATLKVFNTFNSQTETSSGVRLPNCSVTIGRMNLTTVMNDIKTSSRSACVLLCGPRPMIIEASALAVQLKIPFHTETFNY